LGLSQDGLIAIGKVKPFNFVTQPKLHHSGDTTKSIELSFGRHFTRII